MTTTVLLLVNSFTRGGGAERLAIDIASSGGDGLRFVVCSIGDASSDEAQSVQADLLGRGVKTACLAGVGRIQRVRELSNVVSRYNVDLVHVHALSLAALPLIGLRIPFLYTFHAETLAPPFVRMRYALEILLARAAKQTIAVSEAMADVARRRTWLPRVRISVIANGVDLDRLQRAPVPRTQVRARFGIPADVPLVTMLARLDQNKRQDLLLEAVAKLRDQRTHVMLAGSLAADPRWVELLRARASDLALAPRVHFPGIVADAPSLLAASDVLVAASASESFGIAAVEGMALGVPVVASDIPAHRETSDGGRNCLLFRAGNATALERALARALAEPDSLDLSRISSATIARYNMSRVVRAHTSLYRSFARTGEIHL